MAPAEVEGKREETWRPIFDRLQERFPDVGANKIAAILLENNGHAGQAAAALRDLCGTGKRDVDPDDQEHVKTLLTSPVMFAAVCKENFRKFDVNGDGVLSWAEVLPLVNTLYESFGLQPPREGNLRSFFDATDLNKDGVLSEREFKKFFECFLRYAFFDVAQKESNKRGELERSPNKRREVAPEDQRRTSPQKDRPTGYEPSRQEKANLRAAAASSPQGRSRPFKVIAPHGISWRRTPELADRLEQNVPYGQVVQVLEHWVKTDHGWLPVHDTRGKLLIQPMPEDAVEKNPPAVEKNHPAGAAMSACRHDRREKRPKEVESTGWVNPNVEGAQLRSDEEEWKDRFERLQERFPMLSPAQVLQKLRAHQGHAGHTAAALRQLAGRHGGN